MNNRLHYETVSPLLRQILRNLMREPIFGPFRLVGGTSLSLRLGHRVSDDIDLFTDAPYGSLDFKLYESYLQSAYPYYDCPDKTDIVGFGRSYYIGNSEQECIKLDLYYRDGIIDACDIYNGIRIASLEDVIAMKIDVVSRKGRKKDFWDIHELLGSYTIDQMLDSHAKRYEFSHDRTEIIYNLTDFTLADNDIDPICLKGKVWELIKLDFVEMMESYGK